MTALSACFRILPVFPWLCVAQYVRLWIEQTCSSPIDETRMRSRIREVVLTIARSKYVLPGVHLARLHEALRVPRLSSKLPSGSNSVRPQTKPSHFEVLSRILSGKLLLVHGSRPIHSLSHNAIPFYRHHPPLEKLPPYH